MILCEGGGLLLTRPTLICKREEMGGEESRVGVHLRANPNIFVYNFLDPATNSRIMGFFGPFLPRLGYCV